MNIVPYLIRGLATGGQFALVAIGYTMVYGILKLINFAHGDLFMVSGMIMIYMAASFPTMPIWCSMLIMAILTVFIGFLIEKCAYAPLRQAPRMSVMISAIGVSLKILTVVIAATIVGINATALSAVLGTVGLTIGLALQGSLSNFTGGLMILFFQPFKVGDFIDNHTDSGTVREIGIFYTTLDTSDNKRITVPNGVLSNATIVNYSAEKNRRVDMKFSVDYSADIDKVVEILLAVAAADNRILKEPAPFAVLSEHGESALIFTMRVWCASDNYWNVYYYLCAEVKKALDAAGIDIPFNQLNVRLSR